jgi:hypothetical protein
LEVRWLSGVLDLVWSEQLKTLCSRFGISDVALKKTMSLNEPLFDSPFERRGLRILNSLFLAVGRTNGKPSFYGHEALEFHVSFYHQHVRITLDQPKQSSRRGNITTSSGSSNGKLSLSVHEGPNTETALRTWQDSDGVKLEMQMTEAWSRLF